MRDFLVVLLIAAIAIAAGTLLYFLGPASLQDDVKAAFNSATTSNNSHLSFTVLDQGANAISITDRTNYRIDTESDLTSLWPLIYGQNSSTPVPTVDFTKYEVFALFDGSHSQAGYGITLQSISDLNGTRTVTVQHLSPDPSCHTASTATSPFVIVEVPKTTFPLSHVDVMATTTCA